METEKDADTINLDDKIDGSTDSEISDEAENPGDIISSSEGVIDESIESPDNPNNEKNEIIRGSVQIDINENTESIKDDANNVLSQKSTDDIVQITGEGYIRYGNDGIPYLFDENGEMVKKAGTPIVAGHKYWTNMDGSLNSGWLSLGNYEMYFDDSNYEAMTGMVSIEEKRYIFNEDGVKLKNAGTPIINGKKYWFKVDGSLATGWLTLGNCKLYFDKETCEAKIGFTEIGEKKYIFDDNGVLTVKAGTPIINGKKYWFKADGSLGTGWLNLGDWKMYFNTETCEAQMGLNTVGEKRYLFDQNGVLYAQAGTPIINGKKYWFKNDGSLGTGWLTLGAWKLYFDENTCEAKSGLSNIGTKHWLFDNNGVLYAQAGTPVINGKKYWFASDGSLRSGWLSLGNCRMYFAPDTFQGSIGVKNIEGKEYLFNRDGAWVKGPGSAVVNGIIYNVDADGKISVETSKAIEQARAVLNAIGWDLRAAYNWSASKPYYREVPLPANGEKHIEHYASYGFDNLKGNCYVMADTFAVMAKLLGYEVYAVEGRIPRGDGTFGAHGWCEIIIDGATYVFDPEFTNNTGRNGYQITYGTSGTFIYMDYHRVD